MALYIGTNASSLSAQRSLISSQANLQTSFERLSSGNRINSAADDAAGMAIASRLTAQASGLQVAQRNAANGISLVETADAALGTMVDLLTRARDLILQGSDGTLSATDKTAIDAELADISVELERIQDNSNFAGISLFSTDAGVDLVNAEVNIAIDASGTTVAVQLQTTGGDAPANNDTTANYDTALGASKLVDLDFGTAGNVRLELTADNSGTQVYVNSASRVDAIIGMVNQERAQFGALANTFQSAIENLAAMEQGVTTAAGRIMDTDFARESAELAKNQILQQAGTSVLAQANQSTQSVLSLLQ